MKVGNYKLIIIFFTIITLSCNNKEKKDSKNIQTKPNILLLFSDDHQSDLINALGNPYIKTPNLDKLIIRIMMFK